jgi:NAD(P)H-quinone oxidoreductase subunit 4
LATQTYDVKTVALAAQVRNVFSTVVAQKPGAPLYSDVLLAPQLAVTQIQTLVAAE